MQAMNRVFIVIIDVFAICVFVAQMLNAFLMGLSNNISILMEPAMKEVLFSEFQLFLAIVTGIASIWVAFRYVILMQKMRPNMSKTTMQFTIPAAASIVAILLSIALFNLARMI